METVFCYIHISGWSVVIVNSIRRFTLGLVCSCGSANSLTAAVATLEAADGIVSDKSLSEWDFINSKAAGYN